VVITAKVGALAVAALLLAGAGVGVALTRDDDTKQVAAPVEETTTSTSTTVAPTTTSVTPTSAPPTTAVAQATTIRPTTTTARATTTTTKPAAAATVCTPAQLEAKLTTSRPYYAAGQPMEFTTTLRNKTAAPCAHGGWAVQVLFKDEAGHTFPGLGVSVSTLVGDTLAPGQVLTHSGAWDHRACPEPTCGPLPSGPAYVQVTWHLEGYAYDLTQSFILT
jgi:hypothetical protein